MFTPSRLSDHNDTISLEESDLIAKIKHTYDFE